MRTFWTKLKISSAMDSGKPLSAALRQRIETHPEIARFADVERKLGRPSRVLPPDHSPLHDDIMRAVRASTPRKPPYVSPRLSWIAAAATATALAVIWAWLALPRVEPAANPAPFGGLASIVERSLAGALLP